MEDEIYKQCVSTEEIYDIINGEASEELCDLLAEHIKHCEKCRHEYESIKAISSALKDMTSEPSSDFAKNTLAKLKKVKKNPILRITGHPAFRSVTAAAACLILVFIVCSRGIFGTAEEMLFKRNNNDGISVISESDLVDETSTDDLDVSLYTSKSDENVPGSTTDKVDTVSDGEPIPAPVAPAPTPVDPAPFDPANSGKSNDTDDFIQNSAVTVPNATEVVEPLAPVQPVAPIAPEMPYDYYEPTEPDPNTVWVPTGEEDIKEATVQTDPNYEIPDANKPESPVAPPELPSSAPAPVAPNSATSDAGPGNDIEVANPSASDSGGDFVVENPIACDSGGDPSIYKDVIPEYIYIPVLFKDNPIIIYTTGVTELNSGIAILKNNDMETVVSWFDTEDVNEYFEERKSLGFIQYDNYPQYYYQDVLTYEIPFREIEWNSGNTIFRIVVFLDICQNNEELKYTELTLIENPLY
ncbi:MAG: hypothetical protein IJE51_02350 [Clostridia bacterium]|nr:hypothetical protein [Clostridia bacterium]